MIILVAHKAFARRGEYKGIFRSGEENDPAVRRYINTHKSCVISHAGSLIYVRERVRRAQERLYPPVIVREIVRGALAGIKFPCRRFFFFLLDSRRATAFYIYIHTLEATGCPFSATLFFCRARGINNTPGARRGISIYDG